MPLEFLRNLRVGVRLAVGFSIIGALMVVTATTGTIDLHRIRQQAAAIVGDNLRKERMLEEWYSVSLASTQRTTALALASDARLGAIFSAAAKEGTKRNNELQEAIGGMLASPHESELFEATKARRAEYIAARDAVMEARKRGDDAEAQRVFENRFQPQMAAYIDALKAFVQFQQDQIDADARTLDETARTATAVMIGAGIFALCLAMGLAVLISRSILVPLREAREHVQRLADGDLTGAGSVRGQDELAQLLEAQGEAVAHVRSLVADIQNAAQEIRTSANEIATGSLDLSRRTENQAANLEETHASMAALASNLGATVSNARQANELARVAQEVVGEGNTAVSSVVGTMENITQSSRRINEIVEVIDGIAFQTNILALNAAVEAARAGEQGRGFAVVASEVRALAQRSSSAARDIRELIGVSSQRVDEGAQQVHMAGASMQDIVDRISQMSQLVAEITAASTEQSAGISQISAAVAELDQMTQQNAGMVEQSTSAAEGLQQQADRLIEATGAFRI